MSKRSDVTVKIDGELARMAKIVAAYKDVTLAEYLTETLKPIVSRELREYSRRSLGSDPHEGKSPK